MHTLGMGSLVLPSNATLWLERCYFDNFNRKAYPPCRENFGPHFLFFGSIIGDQGTLRMTHSTVRWWAHVRPPPHFAFAGSIVRVVVSPDKTGPPKSGFMV
jgi:hypothetical protein